MDNGESSLRRYMGGDNEAFGEIVETYYRGLVMFAMRYVGDEPEAENIASDALFELMIKQKNLPRCLVVAKLVLENHNTHTALNFSCQDKCNDNNQHDQKYFYKYWHCF